MRVRDWGHRSLRQRVWLHRGGIRPAPGALGALARPCTLRRLRRPPSLHMPLLGGPRSGGAVSVWVERPSPFRWQPSTSRPHNPEQEWLPPPSLPISDSCPPAWTHPLPTTLNSRMASPLTTPSCPLLPIRIGGAQDCWMDSRLHACMRTTTLRMAPPPPSPGRWRPVRGPAEWIRGCAAGCPQSPAPTG